MCQKCKLSKLEYEQQKNMFGLKILKGGKSKMHTADHECILSFVCCTSWAKLTPCYTAKSPVSPCPVLNYHF